MSSPAAKSSKRNQTFLRQRVNSCSQTVDHITVTVIISVQFLLKILKSMVMLNVTLSSLIDCYQYLRGATWLLVTEKPQMS